MLYLFLFLKLPILGLGWIVWWAVHSEPESEPTETPGDDGPRRRRPHPRPPLPRLPRRGPHGEAAPASPPRVRPLSARGRRIPHR
jgi:hypothetical protein